MRSYAGGCYAEGYHSDFVCCRFNSKTTYVWLTRIDWPIIPEFFFWATKASMPWLNWIACTIIPFDNSTWVVSGRPFAANFVQAISSLCILVIEGLHKQAGIIVGPPVATVMHTLWVKRFRSAEAIQGRNCSERDEMNEYPSHHFSNWRTARYLNDGLSFYDLVDRSCLCWVRLCRLNTSIAGAASPADYSLGAFSSLFQNIEWGFAADHAVYTVSSVGNRALHA